MTRFAAIISQCGAYRYRLEREWYEASGKVCWLMLNPSTADATVDDPTIRRCVGYAKRWGFGGIIVVNLFALRATDPKELRRHPHPVGPENDEHIVAGCKAGTLTIAGYGRQDGLEWRAESIKTLLMAHGVELKCLGKTQAGAPRHPLYMRADLDPVPL